MYTPSKTPVTPLEPPAAGLQRHLQNRHIQLIAIGGAIGTGLFMGSGKTISLAGPSVIFTYAIIGFFAFMLMRAMGELLMSNLNYKSFVDFTYDIMGPMAGFITGWTYWLCWVVVAIADVSAITSYVQFWYPNVPLWMPGTFAAVLVILLNSLSVKWFGETEFWFAMIKIVAILALIIVGFILVLTGFTDPQGNVASVSNLWQHGGWFPEGLSGFMAAFQIALFAFAGMEVVGTTAAETDDPTKTLPRAINAIPIRILLFYILSLLVIMMVTPWNRVTATESPFVNMFVLLGIPIAASLINFVVLTSAASSVNSGIYSNGRMLYGLATGKLAPRFFSRLTAFGVPFRSVFFSALFMLIGVALLYSKDGNAMATFTLVSTVVSVLFIFIWGMIAASYIRYRAKYPERHQASRFRLPFGTVMAYMLLAFFAFCLYLFSQQEDTLQGLKYTPIWFVILLIAYPFYRKAAIAHQATIH